MQYGTSFENKIAWLVSEKFEYTNWCCVVQLLFYAEYASVKPTNNRD